MTTFDQRHHFNSAVLPTITLEHAKQWAVEQDAVCWIEYTFLDPNDLPRSADMIARVENRFEFLLRQDRERQILEKLVDDALFYGCTVSVYDGEEWPLRRSQDRAAILEATRSTESDVLAFHDADGVKIGNVWLIYGNDYDLISDCSEGEALQALLDGAEALAESLQGC